MSEVETSPRPKKSSKKGPKKSAVPADGGEVLKLRWDLHEFPSSQHRAGLAGLALAVAFLQRKPDRQGVCRVEALDASGLILGVDRAGMQSLFDDLYDAGFEETASKSKWKGAEPKRVDEIEITDKGTGKTKREKRYVYDRVVPRGALVDDWDNAASGAPKLWLKLWRDLVWSTLRGVPAQREPYNARAERRSIDDGGEAWDDLATRRNKSLELPSTYSIGAQAKSAENVPFEDVCHARFLLHFWHLIAATYVPAKLLRDGSREFLGHALAVPDVAVLDHFTDVWETFARQRSSDASGYLPREAIVDLAGEAGLDVVRRTNDVLAAKQGATSTRQLVTAVDVFHVEKDGNNVRLRAVSRVVPNRVRDDAYVRVRNANYWSSLFRRQRIANVLHDRPWWHGFGRECATEPRELTIEHQGFRHDCRLAMTEVEMKEEAAEADQTIEHLVFKRVQAYVLGRTESKFQLSWSKAQGNAAKEKEYREKREKIAREAFLAVRSRTGADFVAYFTSTLCSVPQHTSEAKFIEIARALLDPESTEKVRSLTLLALSAVA